MHELSSTEISYADYLLNSNKIEEIKYVEMLKSAETSLKKSLEMLMYEPRNSPEGRLMQQCLLEMKTIRRIIQDN